MGNISFPKHISQGRSLLRNSLQQLGAPAAGMHRACLRSWELAKPATSPGRNLRWSQCHRDWDAQPKRPCPAACAAAGEEKPQKSSGERWARSSSGLWAMGGCVTEGSCPCPCFSGKAPGWRAPSGASSSLTETRAQNGKPSAGQFMSKTQPRGNRADLKQGLPRDPGNVTSATQPGFYVGPPTPPVPTWHLRAGLGWLPRSAWLGNFSVVSQSTF